MTTTVYTKTSDVDKMLDVLRTLISSPRVEPTIIDYHPESRKGIVYKIGKYTKKTVNYVKRTESKTGVLVATWVVESIAYALTFLVLLSSGAVVTAALWTALYVYITYAFFDMLKDSVVFNSIIKGS